FIKHKLKVKYYLRYVDDFMILHENKNILEIYKNEINDFLKDNLKIELHEEKSKIFKMQQGINFLGFRNFYYNRVLKRKKRKLLKKKINLILKEYEETKNYNKFIQKIEALFAHLETGNTYNLRKKIVNKIENEL
ncbi:MAG: reverse transcriptase domain-containing protein, partial [Nanoarchaeota archaeon]